MKFITIYITLLMTLKTVVLPPAKVMVHKFDPHLALHQTPRSLMERLHILKLPEILHKYLPILVNSQLLFTFLARLVDKLTL